MPLWRFLAMVLLGASGLAALTIWVFPPGGDFHWRNPFWNGLEELLEEHRITPVASVVDLPGDPASSALLVIPYRRPTDQDISRYNFYLEGGGTLILADDYGFGNSILEGLRTPHRFSGEPLLDPLFNYRDNRFPLAVNISPSPLTTGVSSLALNYATTLEDSDAIVVARSSSFSYLDQNNNGSPDPEEPLGPFPVVAYSSVAAGRLILVSDPSLFINSMQEAEDNARFVANLTGSLGSPARIFLERRLLPGSNLAWAKEGLTTFREVVGRPGVLAALAAGLATIMLYPVWRKKGAAS